MNQYLNFKDVREKTIFCILSQRTNMIKFENFTATFQSRLFQLKGTFSFVYLNAKRTSLKRSGSKDTQTICKCFPRIQFIQSFFSLLQILSTYPARFLNDYLRIFLSCQQSLRNGLHLPKLTLQFLFLMWLPATLDLYFNRLQFLLKNISI